MNLIAVVCLFGLIGILFYELFVRLQVIGDIRRVFEVAPAAARVIRSSTLSDEEKEKTVRQMSLTVLKDTLTFTAKVGAILLACVALAAIAQFLFDLSPDGLGGLLAAWEGLVAAVVAVLVYTRFRSRRPAAGGDATASATGQYSAIDRLLHRVAFLRPGLQRTLGDVENDLFKKALADVEVRRPVFITGLPRAGTTLLLELLHDTGQFASFTYRQMPFVLNPLLWDRLSAGSRRQGEVQERAHGDGMLVSYDSPEAFEEVLWVNYLGDTIFEGDTMRPLQPADLDTRFREAFVTLARKLVCLKGRDREPATPAPRYLSKNNANLSRLAAIRSVFADAELLLCYRHPATHVASLHTQHLRFLEMHRDDAFARQYMRWIGHHDFGANFRPIRFGEQITLAPTDRLFWLQYWVDAYRYVLQHAPENTRFIGYESLLANGAADLQQLADNLALDDPGALTRSAERLRAPGSAADSLADLSAELAAEAESIYSELVARSVAQGYTGA